MPPNPNELQIAFLISFSMATLLGAYALVKIGSGLVKFRVGGAKFFTKQKTSQVQIE